MQFNGRAMHTLAAVPLGAHGLVSPAQRRDPETSRPFFCTLDWTFNFCQFLSLRLRSQRPN